MNYLGRPVFEFLANWDKVPAKKFSYNLREIATGFGAEYFNQLQQHVTQSWQFNLLLDPTSLAAFDDFTAALNGNLKGFWLPEFTEAAQIVAANSATAFDVTDQNLRATWQDHPDIYLWITRRGASPRIAKITNVASIAGGRERITIDTTLSPAPTVDDDVRRLLYVRLAADSESGTFHTEGLQNRAVQVVELPTEYIDYETGELPIYLYHFWCAEPMDAHWRYTSFAANVVSGGELYTAFPISHRSLKDSVKLENQSLSVEAKYDVTHPLALFLPIPLSKPLFLEIIKVTFAAPETQTKIFSGSVRKVDDTGDRISASCDSWLAVLSRKLPRMNIQKECNYNVFDPLTCKVSQANFEMSASVYSTSPDALPPLVVLDFGLTDSPLMVDWSTADWFAGGFIETGYGSSYKVRTILGSSVIAGSVPRLRLELNLPFEAPVGQRVSVVPGCDGIETTCQSKFLNFGNFGGFIAVPERNPSLKAIDSTVAQGGKGK